MRITIVTGAFLPLPPGPAGAVEKMWYGLAGEFVSRGHEVFMVSREPAQAAEDVADGIKHIRRHGYGRSGWIAWDLLRDLAYSCDTLSQIPRCDVVITNTFWLPAILGLRRSPRPIIVVDVNRFPKGQMRLYWRAARLRATSTAIQKAILHEWPRSGCRVKVIPNTVDTAVFHSRGAARLAATEERTILYTGRVHPEKGVHVLIQAFRTIRQRHKHIQVVIIGPAETGLGGGGPAYVQLLKRLAEDLPVTLTGPVLDPRRLATALRSAHYYCYPSLAERGESFGVAPLEAMATGLAPVVSDLACFRDFIEDGVTGLIFSHRGDSPAQNLADKLLQLLESPALNASMGERAAIRAQDFSVSRVADQLLGDFGALLDE